MWLRLPSVALTETACLCRIYGKVLDSPKNLAVYAQHIADALAGIGSLDEPPLVRPPTIPEPPQVNSQGRNRYPKGFLATGLTEGQLFNVFVKTGGGKVSVPNIQFEICYLDKAFDRYVMTLEGITLPPFSSSLNCHRLVEDSLRQAMASSTRVDQFLQGHHDNTPQHLTALQAKACIMKSVKARPMTMSSPIKNAAGEPTPVTYWHIHVDNPTCNPADHESWIEHMRTLRFETGFGSAFHWTHRTCNYCFGTDHPVGLCPFKLLPGWFGAPQDRAPPPPKQQATPTRREGRFQGRRQRYRN